MLVLLFKAKQTNDTSQHSGDYRRSGKSCAKVSAGALRRRNLCFRARLCHTRSVFAQQKARRSEPERPGKGSGTFPVPNRRPDQRDPLLEAGSPTKGVLLSRRSGSPRCPAVRALRAARAGPPARSSGAGLGSAPSFPPAAEEPPQPRSPAHLRVELGQRHRGTAAAPTRFRRRPGPAPAPGRGERPCPAPPK